MGDFNTRLCSNFLDGLQDHIGAAVFAPELDEDSYPQTNLSFLTEFLISNELAIVSTMRPRPPSQLINYSEIASDPPRDSCPTLDTYAVLDHVMARAEHRYLFRDILSHPQIQLPWHHRRFLLSAQLRLQQFVPNNKTIKLLLRLDSVSPPRNTKLHIKRAVSQPSSFPHHLPPIRLRLSYIQTALALINTTSPMPTPLDGECTLNLSIPISTAQLGLFQCQLKDLIILPNFKPPWRLSPIFFHLIPLLHALFSTLVLNMSLIFY